MTQARTFASSHASFLVVAGLFALILVCLPVGMSIDSSADRTRPMYDDMARMAALQDRSIADSGRPVPARLGEGDTVEVAGQEFTPSAGVSLEVRAVDADTYCVRASNQHGDESRERCNN